MKRVFIPLLQLVCLLLCSEVERSSCLFSVGFGPQHISPVVDVEVKDAAESGLFYFFNFLLLSGALHERFDIFPATSCFSEFVCAICVAQHERAARVTSQLGGALGSAPKVKPAI